MDSRTEPDMHHSDNEMIEAGAQETERETLLTTRQHVHHVWAITGPIIVSEIFQNTLPIVDIAFVGQMLDKNDLAAAALATVWFNLWNSTMLGFMTAVDTLLSQSYGARDLESFSKWTGTSLIAVFVASVGVAGLIALCQPIMGALGQEFAAAAGAFSFRLIPGLFPFYLFKVLVKYLQTQNKLWPGVMVGVVANAFNIGCNWLLIRQIGINGAPWATTFTRFLQLFLIMAYLWWTRKNNAEIQKTWPKIAKEHLSWMNTKAFLKLSFSGALSIAAEAWSFELTSILAGFLGTIQLDAHVVSLSIATFIYISFPFAIGLSASIRVGHLIGEGRSVDAKRSCYVSLGMSTVTQAILTAVLLPLGDFVGKSFSSDEDVARLVTKLIPVSCVFMMGDAVQAVIGGILRGLGRQNLLLLLNILGYWMLALPAGCLLTFVADTGVFGLWWGFVIGIYSTSAIGIYFLTTKIDWDEEASRAAARLEAMSSAVC